ncbi:MAG: hypothetical protein SF187_04080 [Deltaproteobacteria bacterium]|nr:hypothetical protein [Deltaproteobacteria bacterium]
MSHIIQLNVHVLLQKEGPYWVAQCLQHDVAGQGKSVQDAAYAVEKALVSHLAMGLELKENPLATLPGPAPQTYWTKWESGWQMKDDLSLPFSIQNIPAAPRVEAELRVA